LFGDIIAWSICGYGKKQDCSRAVKSIEFVFTICPSIIKGIAKSFPHLTKSFPVSLLWVLLSLLEIFLRHVLYNIL
jgi:hypothetical protein